MTGRRVRMWLAGGAVALLGALALALLAGRDAPPAAGPASTNGRAAPAATGTVLITGAGRGIGLALAEAFAARGWAVIATARRPEQSAALQALAARYPTLSVERLDVTNDAEIAALAAKLRGRPIDVLLNNAGSNAGGRGQRPGEFDDAVFEELMRVNALAPLKMAEAFLPNVLASEQRKIVVISSIQASIARTFGGSYHYRASKAAVNMLMRTLSRDLAAQGVIVGILSPGVVATDMNRGLDYPMISPEESARGLLQVIEGLQPQQSGAFLEYDGTELPW